MPAMKSFVLAVALLPIAAAAEAPLPLTNLATLARGFALPVLGYTGVQPVDSADMRFSMDLINEFRAISSARESLRIDGETFRLGLGYRKTLAPGLEASIELPFYFQNGGIYDEVVTGFHSLIGQSNASRDRFPSREYVFQYVKDGVAILDRQRSSNVPGDVSFSAGWQLRPATALRGQLKLPTGAASQLAGNGAAGASVWVDTAMPWFAPGSAWSGFLSGGSGYALPGDVIRNQQERWLLFGGGGLAWRASPVVRVLAQAYGHSALYKDSAFDTLSGPALIAALGVRWKFAAGTELEYSVIEDVFVGPAPDFSMRLALHWGL